MLKLTHCGAAPGAESDNVCDCSVQIQLPAYIENVKEKLAENLHEMWAMGKIDSGWIYGEVRIRHRHRIDKYLDTLLAKQTSRTVKPPITAKRVSRKMADYPSYY